MAFTFIDYDLFLRDIKNNQANVITAKKYFSLLKNNNLRNLKNLVIKHDVETSTEKALKVAIIENKYNFYTTYYFQDYLLHRIKDIKNIQAIKDLGHEIAFHYDSLDRFQGNIKKAMDNFSDSINLFKTFGHEIYTVCPHGNAALQRNGWDSNKDLRNTIKQFYPFIDDIVVDGSSEIDYFTDASYKLKLVRNIKNVKQNYTIISKKNFIQRIKSSKGYSTIVLSLHTHRFSSSNIKILVSRLRLDTLRFFFNIFKKIPFFSRIGFYIYKVGKYL